MTVSAAPAKGQLFFGKDTESLSDVFAFAGPAPERVNGRVAMWAFAAAVAAEAASGRSVVEQLAAAPVSVALTVLLITLGSLMPKFASGVALDSLIASSSREGLPPQLRFFNKTHEIWLGRVAMLGFSGLVATELILKRALF
ncbi:hypothetical protein WJX81_003398 [Elliptochloris bilobata]|uniref:Early light-inducible protein n=1 Tax=Elliptochloris bilobata TaxID=381761 RepID=A0AAW1RKP9_9CHLO